MLAAGAAEYRVVACAPAGEAPAPIGAGMKLVALLGLLGRPLEVAQPEADWLATRLPAAESEFLHDTNIELLVPAIDAAGRTRAILALGPKRSEEPYTADDQELFVAIADSLSWVIDRPSSLTAASAAFEECPECGACYQAGASTCTNDA